MKRVIAWFLYAGIMFVVFLLVTFPYEQLQARMLAELARSSGLTITARQWGLVWPPGFEWREVGITAIDRPRIQVERIRLSLTPMGMLRGRPIVDGRMELSGETDAKTGWLEGRGILESWRHPMLVQLTGRMQALDVGRLQVPVVRRALVSGRFDQHWSPGAGSGQETASTIGDGDWQLEVSDVQLDGIPLGAMVLPGIRLTNVKGALQCRSGSCTLESLNGAGPDGAVSGSGTLVPRAPLVDSEMALTVMLTASGEFAQRASAAGIAVIVPNVPMTIKLRGPLGKPQLAF